jgi:hypothetical protein
VTDRHFQGDEAAEAIGENVSVRGQTKIVEQAGNCVGMIVKRSCRRRRGAEPREIDHDQPALVGKAIGENFVGRAITEKRIDQDQVATLSDDFDIQSRLSHSIVLPVILAAQLHIVPFKATPSAVARQPAK